MTGKTIDGRLAEPPVSFSLSREMDPLTEQLDVAIEIENLGDREFEEVSVTWHYSELQGARPKGFSTTEFGSVGQGPLKAGQSRRFTFQPEWLDRLASEVDTVSSDQYDILLTVDGVRVTLMTGQAFGGWIECEFGFED